MSESSTRKKLSNTYFQEQRILLRGNDVAAVTVLKLYDPEKSIKLIITRRFPIVFKY